MLAYASQAKKICTDFLAEQEHVAVQQGKSAADEKQNDKKRANECDADADNGT